MSRLFDPDFLLYLQTGIHLQQNSNSAKISGRKSHHFQTRRRHSKRHYICQNHGCAHCRGRSLFPTQHPVPGLGRQRRLFCRRRDTKSGSKSPRHQLPVLWDLQYSGSTCPTWGEWRPSAGGCTRNKQQPSTADLTCCSATIRCGWFWDQSRQAAVVANSAGSRRKTHAANALLFFPERHRQPGIEPWEKTPFIWPRLKKWEDFTILPASVGQLRVVGLWLWRQRREYPDTSLLQHTLLPKSSSCPWFTLSTPEWWKHWIRLQTELDAGRASWSCIKRQMWVQKDKLPLDLYRSRRGGGRRGRWRCRTRGGSEANSLRWLGVANSRIISL